MTQTTGIPVTMLRLMIPLAIAFWHRRDGASTVEMVAIMAATTALGLLIISAFGSVGEGMSGKLVEVAKPVQG
jgi:Flp pilus assembly protein TadG